MDVLYNKNAILPDQEDFVFDIRKDFDIEKYEAEWDDDQEDDIESDENF